MPTLEEVQANTKKRGFQVKPKKISRTGKRSRVWEEKVSQEDVATNSLSCNDSEIDTDLNESTEGVLNQEPVPKKEPVSTKEPVPEKELVLTIEPVPEKEPVLTIEPVPKKEPVLNKKPVREIKRPDFDNLKPRIVNGEIINSKVTIKMYLFFELNLSKDFFNGFGLDFLTDILSISKGAIKKSVKELTMIGFLENKVGKGLDQNGKEREEINLFRLK